MTTKSDIVNNIGHKKELWISAGFSFHALVNKNILPYIVKQSLTPHLLFIAIGATIESYEHSSVFEAIAVVVAGVPAVVARALEAG